MNDPLAELKDIAGLDPIHWWPLAIGWWVALGLVLCAVIGIVIYYRRNQRRKQSWQAAFLSELEQLQKQCQPEQTHQTILALSELIRCIAIARYSRSACAGLHGAAWLAWLTKHDPKQFNWTQHGAHLIESSYAPAKPVDFVQLAPMIEAMKAWCHYGRTQKGRG